jgi:hypothetical protein
MRKAKHKVGILVRCIHCMLKIAFVVVQGL